MKNLKVLEYNGALLKGYRTIRTIRHLLMSLVCILVISCSTNYKNYIKLQCKDKSAVLYKNDFQAIKYKNYIELKVLKESKLDLIKKLMNCNIMLTLDNKKYVAKGINFKESRKPEGCNYFFSEFDNGCIIVQDERIFLKSIDI